MDERFSHIILVAEKNEISADILADSTNILNSECNYIQLASSNYISIVQCVFSQEKNDWRRTAIFYTFIKIGDKLESNSG